MTNDTFHAWPIERFPKHEVVTVTRWIELNPELLQEIIESRHVEKMIENFEQTFEDFLIDEVGIEHPRDDDETMVKMDILHEICKRAVAQYFGS